MENDKVCPVCNSKEVYSGIRAARYDIGIYTSDFKCANEHYWMEVDSRDNEKES